jgi:hypothetical protein
MIPIFTAKTDGRTLTFDTPVRLQNYLFNLKGQKLEVIVRKFRSKRSNNQNSYYWYVVLDTLHKHTGHSDYDLHEMMKYKFLKVHGEMEYVKSTTKLNTAEFEVYLDKIRKWAEDKINCKINLPNEVDYD